MQSPAFSACKKQAAGHHPVACFYFYPDFFLTRLQITHPHYFLRRLRMDAPNASSAAPSPPTDVPINAEVVGSAPNGVPSSKIVYRPLLRLLLPGSAPNGVSGSSITTGGVTGVVGVSGGVVGGVVGGVGVVRSYLRTMTFFPFSCSVMLVADALV